MQMLLQYENQILFSKQRLLHKNGLLLRSNNYQLLLSWKHKSLHTWFDQEVFGDG